MLISCWTSLKAGAQGLKTTGSSFRTSLSRIIDFVKAHSKTYDNDKERPTEINEQTIEAVRDYMLDDLKKYDAASVKYQWMKRTGETVTMEVSIEKPEQEGSHEEAAGD